MKHLIVPLLPDSGRFRIDADGSHHLLHVLRMERQGHLQVSDGQGRKGMVRLVDVRGGIAELEVETTEEVPPPLERVVLLGIPKGPLLEEALTLGTEAGATGYRLIQARYSQTGATRTERLERVLRVACTQCHRSHLPRLAGPMRLEEALLSLPALRWVGVHGAAAPPAAATAAALAIGPEGGWSPEEYAVLHEHHFLPAGLGPFVLRNPTAVAVGLGRLFPG